MTITKDNQTSDEAGAVEEYTNLYVYANRGQAKVNKSKCTELQNYDNLQCKMNFNGRQLPMEDDLQWKTTSTER